MRRICELGSCRLIFQWKFINTSLVLITVLYIFFFQNKIQDELIAREIVINDAEPAIRCKLTKRQTQEEVILLPMKTLDLLIICLSVFLEIFAMFWSFLLLCRFRKLQVL